jgi:UDP-N-acetylmuramoyl-tripeptide--D-alanyl-D-alanine ligase
MGARGIGHIAELCAVGQPTVGIVTTVALAHSELFGSIEGVTAAKGELIEALPADGVAILNADNPHVVSMAERASCEVVTFGVDAGDVRASDVSVDDVLRPSFVIETPVGSAAVRLDVRGAHMALNAAAATAAALAVGVELDDVVAGLAAAVLSPWRMEVTEAPSGLVVINDAYNANPTSMRAALRALSELPVDERVAVVGEMAELGDEGEAEHLAVAAEAAAAGIRMIAVAAPAYGPNVEHVADRNAAQIALGEGGAERAVLVKGSRVAGLEELATSLLAT